MAPSATTRGKKRDNQYFEVGVQGRKTGITLPENPRDEYGIEDLNGIFSSPEKSPPKRVLRGENTLTSSAMELEQSSVPEPTEVLSTRRLIRNAKTVLPPPPARSPFKTNIGSSPRRQSSVAPMSEARQKSMTPSRRLDFLNEEQEAVLAKSPLRGGARRRHNLVARDVYDVVEEDDEEIFIRQQETHRISRSSPSRYINDDSLQLLDDGDFGGGVDVDVDLEPVQTSSPTNHRLSRRKTRTSGGESALPDPSEDLPETLPIARPAPRQRGKKQNLLVSESQQHASAAGPPLEVEETIEESVMEPLEESVIELVQPKKRGRPKKTLESSMLDDSAVARVAPKKRGRPARSKVAIDESMIEDGEPRPIKRAKKTTKGPLTSRDPNARLAHVFKRPDVPTAKNVSPSRRSSPSMWAGARAVSRLREGTPAVDAATNTTRSGRTVLPPLQFWCNEQAKYLRDGTIAEVQFSEEVPLVRQANRKSKKGRKGGRPAKSLDDIEEEEEEEESDEEPEDWEVRCDVIAGLTKGWDTVNGTILEEEETEADIAFGKDSFYFKPANGAKFEFAKLQSLDFFGTGVVEIPVGGYKKTKNARRMQMVFFVHTGKLEVTVGDTEFRISKGGIWHVPRGNWYGITNAGNSTARIFFAQGCEVDSQAVHQADE